MNYNEQIGIITYPEDEAQSNFVRHHVAYERSRGNVIVFCAGYARIHKP